ncbi:hypothetical protein GGI07_001283 [Coemansia sp. Benny D115]|nr:hypothetical protein GGI07_001283 [Coemansia sp. Benny D115]
MADTAFFDATLAQLFKLPALRTCNADTKAPEGLRYPPGHYDFKMPSIQTAALPAEDREDYFSLTFRTLKAPVRKFTLHTSSIRTVAQVKRHLSKISNIPVSSMRLVLNGKGLVDTKLIGDYSIQDKSVIQIITKSVTSAPGESAADDSVGVIDAEAEESNPLSNALRLQESQAQSQEDINSAIGQTTREFINSQEAAAAGDGHHEYHTDASSDFEADRQVINETTKSQLKMENSSFRNGLRELVHTRFSSAQAAAIDRAFDDFFSTL